MVAMSHVSQVHVLRQRRVEYAHGLMRREENGLLAAAGDLAGRDVLVLGPVVASTMGALASSACRRAESRLPGCRVEAGLADVVIIPLASSEAMPGLVRQAAVALSGGGSLVVRLPRRARAADETRACLAAAGFADLREVLKGGERILLAEAPRLQPAG